MRIRTLLLASGMATTLPLGVTDAYVHGGLHEPMDGHLIGNGDRGNIEFVSRLKVPGAQSGDMLVNAFFQGGMT